MEKTWTGFLARLIAFVPFLLFEMTTRRQGSLSSIPFKSSAKPITGRVRRTGSIVVETLGKPRQMGEAMSQGWNKHSFVMLCHGLATSSAGVKKASAEH